LNGATKDRPSVSHSGASLRLVVPLVLSVAGSFIAGCASYAPKPLAPATTAASLERRTLDEPRLAAFIAAAASSTGGRAEGWDVSTLTLAALYYHPDIEISRTRLALAKAGITTAGQVPNPTLTFSPANAVLANEAVAPLTIGVLVTFVIETFGKRDARIAQAQNLGEAARQDLATAAWQVRAGVRTALLDLWASNGRLRLAQKRRALQEQIVALLERRFTAGDSSALDVARERINLSQVTIAARDAERQSAEARARLAAAVGVPVRAIDQVKLDLGAFDNPPNAPDPHQISEGWLRQQALLERTDVLGLLAEYDAAQSALRLEVAKQYPDIKVGPGYTFDRGDNLYAFELLMDLPIFNQNQGQVSQAEARRREAAAKLVALQAKIIGDIDRAHAAYRGAQRTLATADALLQSQARRRQQLDRAYQLGEVDRLAPLTADLEQEVVQLAHYEALVQQRESLAAVEDALHRSMFDAGDSYVRVPEKQPGSPGPLDTGASTAAPR
jgi:outer membrane protein, heavy metal efflux system